MYWILLGHGHQSCGLSEYLYWQVRYPPSIMRDCAVEQHYNGVAFDPRSGFCWGLGIGWGNSALVRFVIKNLPLSLKATMKWFCLLLPANRKYTKCCSVSLCYVRKYVSTLSTLMVLYSAHGDNDRDWRIQFNVAESGCKSSLCV